MTKYEKLERILEEDPSARFMTFDAVCGKIRGSATSLGEIIEEELGMNGEEFMHAYRNCM